MKVHTDQENGWAQYTRDGPGLSPRVRHHFSGEISLISPADREDKVTLNSASEIFFALSVIKQIQKADPKEVFKEREDNLTITYSSTNGLIIRHRQLPHKQFHCVSQKSLDFLVEALEHISDQPT